MKNWLSLVRKGSEQEPTFEVNKPGQKYENPKVRKTIFGTKYWVPVVEKMGDPLKETQSELFSVLQKLYQKFDGAFIDVGVNVGQTLVKLHSINPEIPYVGFETNIYCCFYVDQFLLMNRSVKNKVVFPIALSNKVHVAKLYRKGLVGAGASIVDRIRDSHADFKHQHAVLAIDGDSVLPALDIQTVGVIKLDVEGGELEVLNGLVRTLKNERPFVICESKPIFDKRTNESEENGVFRDGRRKQIQKLIADLEFAIFKIDDDGHLSKVAEIDSREVDTRDYLMVPLERYESHKEFFNTF